MDLFETAEEDRRIAVYENFLSSAHSAFPKIAELVAKSTYLAVEKVQEPMASALKSFTTAMNNADVKLSEARKIRKAGKV